ncbi:MAG: glycosyltransferase family 4 protein [Herpetosiphon sp.]
MILWVVPWIACGFVAYWGTGWLCRTLKTRNRFDMPNERSSHSIPTPRGGGALIVSITLLGLIALETINPQPAWSRLLYFVCGAIIIAGTSLRDDFESVSNRIRIGVQAIGGVLAISAFGYWTAIYVPGVGRMHLGVLGLPLTLIWIVGLTNAYNFMDGIDGIAASQAIVAAMGWALVGWMQGSNLVVALGLLIAATSAGFLGHNWSPAHIFMGDVGSSFLGYSFAVLPLMATAGNERLSPIGILLVWPFLFDTILTFVLRVVRGEPVWAPHRSHLYQRLVIAGNSHARVAALYCGLGLSGVAFMWIWIRNSPWNGVTIATAIPMLAFMLWCYVVSQERRQKQRPSVAIDVS